VTDPTRALQIAERIRLTRPPLYADPRVQFPLVAVQRRAGKLPEATRLLKVLESGPLESQWRRIAGSEARLINRSIPVVAADSAMVTASRAASKPKLDGSLGDSCWRAGTWMQIAAPESGPLTECMLLYDADFVFVALRCQNVARPDPQTLQAPRTRDASLRHRDRVELDLDVDRDYHTFYRLTIDQHGWTNEACGDDLRWDPQWFVAAGSTETEWRIEAAIPRTELDPNGRASGDAWCVRFRRVLPNSDHDVREQPGGPEVPFLRLRFSDNTRGP
jgi:hypothetical protein